MGRKWKVRSAFLTLLGLVVSVRADELTVQDVSHMYRGARCWCVCMSGEKSEE